MIAQLSMYWRTATAPAHHAFWDLIRDGLRARGIDAPDTLDTTTEFDAAWAAPDLVLAQVCNLPLRRELPHLTRIAACDYGLEGVPAGAYFSHFVTRDDHRAATPHDLAGARMAYNGRQSQSGWAAPLLWAAAQGIDFDDALPTGSHEAALEAVIADRADFASIDAQTWRGLCEDRPELTARARLIGRTAASPGQTLCTRAGQDPAPYLAALEEALAALPAPHKAALGLKGLVVLPAEAYDLPLPHR